MEINDLGLAAYMRMHGVALISAKNGNVFEFEVTEGKSANEWEIEYVNSCCFRHDRELMSLRRLTRNNDFKNK